MANKKDLSKKQHEQLIKILKERFEKNINRHKDIEWTEVLVKLNSAAAEKLWSLFQMENSGGEPDVVDFDGKTGEYFFSTVQRKVPKAAEACVTIVKHWNQERNTSRKTAHWMWLLKWALKF